MANDCKLARYLHFKYRIFSYTVIMLSNPVKILDYFKEMVSLGPALWFYTGTFQPSLWVFQLQKTLHWVVFYKFVSTGPGSALKKQLYPEPHWKNRWIRIRKKGKCLGVNSALWRSFPQNKSNVTDGIARYKVFFWKSAYVLRVK